MFAKEGQENVSQWQDDLYMFCGDAAVIHFPISAFQAALVE